MNKITMREIRKAWNTAVDALFKHDHKTRPPEMEEFFMTELNKLGHDMSDIITHIYCKYEEVDKENKELNYKVLQNMTEITELNGQLANTIRNSEQLDDWMRSLSNQITDLESSLLTARYYIYLSGMCGFLLGLACLFLVV